VTPKEREDGAWALLAALEKAKEAHFNKVARLASSLEVLLPNHDGTLAASIERHQQHTILNGEEQSHSTDPAFWSLPEIVADPSKLNGDTVRTILQATRQGRRVDLKTIEAILKAATVHFQAQSDWIVKLPPLLPQQQLTVIGDLHGSLSDLEAVLGLTGEPNANNVLVFNGDFADRGDHGIEIILLVSSLCLAYPDYVHVNRGNHEDLTLSMAYGLAAEVQHKYGAHLFQSNLSPLLDALFRSLPLVTLIEGDALIVHAGPPPPSMTLERIGHYLQDDHSQGFSRTIQIESKPSKEQKAQEIIEALLWSDPIVDEGKLVDYHEDNSVHLSGWIFNDSRGAGRQYDASMIRHVLEQGGLHRFIRSHEVVQHGCERYSIERSLKNNTSAGNTPSNQSQKPLELFTVFSASRYPHKEGFNQGALLKLLPDGKHTVIRYATEEDEPRVGSVFTSFDEENTCSPLCKVDSLSIFRALRQVVSPHKSRLVEALQQLRSERPSKQVPFQEVADTIMEVCKLHESGIDKPGARLALAEALSLSCRDNQAPDTITLDKCLGNLLQEEEDEDDIEFLLETTPFLPWLRDVFEMVDADHDGVLSRSEWLKAVDKLNSDLREDQKHIDAEKTWKLLDRDGDGEVGLKEWDELGKVLSR